MQAEEVFQNKTYFSKNALIVRSNAFTAMHIDDELVCMNVETGDYFGLNATGKLIWELLETPLDAAQIVDRLSIAFGQEDSLAQDVDTFLTHLVRLNIITVCDSPTSPKA